MSLDITGLLDKVRSHAMASGAFERTATHEPKAAPGPGLTWACWADTIGPARTSGLAATSALIVFKIRIFADMLRQPQDDIDPDVIRAVDVLLDAYLDDFTLDGAAMAVDVRGMAGVPVSVQAGYIPIDKALFRCMTINLPLIINDVWSESP